jgi:hypothetical protein
LLQLSFSSPKQSSEATVKESHDRTKAKPISTPSAATSSLTSNESVSTMDVSSNLRHEQAALKDTDSTSSVCSQNPNTTPPTSDHLEGSKKEIENKAPKFAMPALPSPKKPKPKLKAVVPDSSLSKVLEGLKSSNSHDKDHIKEHTTKKHQHAEESSETSQVNKKDFFLIIIPKPILPTSIFFCRYDRLDFHLWWF